MCISSYIVWKVFVNNYKIHDKDVALPSQFPSTSLKIITCKINNPKIIHVKIEPHNPPVVFDLNGNTNDDDAIMIPNLTILYKSCKRQCCSQVYSSTSQQSKPSISFNFSMSSTFLKLRKLSYKFPTFFQPIVIQCYKTILVFAYFYFLHAIL
jgi:hypothetical protein